MLHHLSFTRNLTSLMLTSLAANKGPQALPLVAVPFGSRGISKYKRVGLWTRGQDGLYDMSDPRIYKPGMRRKYPFHKQRQRSTPYYCKQYSPEAPVGNGIVLKIWYTGFEQADAYYKTRHLLQDLIPGAQIIPDENAGDPKHGGDAKAMRLVRSSDNRTLFEWSKEETEKPNWREKLAEQVVPAAVSFRLPWE